MAVSDVGAEQEAELPSLAGLPESVLLHIVHACMHDGCGSVFWTLSQVSLQLAAVAAQAAACLTHIDNAALDFPPRVYSPKSKRPLLRLVSCLSGVHTIALDGAYSAVVYNLVDDEVLEAIGRSCRQVRSLELKACEQITAHGLQAMAQAGGMQQLQVLSLRSCRDIGDGRFLRRLPSLKSLDISWCYSVKASEVAAIGAQLEELNATGCDHLGDSVCKGLPNIRSLNVRMTPITDRGLMSLAEHSPQLNALSLAWRMNNVWMDAAWSDSGLRTLQQRRPDIAVQLVA